MARVAQLLLLAHYVYKHRAFQRCPDYIDLLHVSKCHTHTHKVQKNVEVAWVCTWCGRLTMQFKEDTHLCPNKIGII